VWSGYARSWLNSSIGRRRYICCAHLRDRYRNIARTFGFEGHIAWGEACHDDVAVLKPGYTGIAGERGCSVESALRQVMTAACERE
jgi:hypothetical protein